MATKTIPELDETTSIDQNALLVTDDGTTTKKIKLTNLGVSIKPFINFFTAIGDVLYGGVSGAQTKLTGNTTTTKMFLSQTGTGTASAAPAWSRIRLTVQKFKSGSGTYTQPSNCTRIKVKLMAAGGGAGGIVGGTGAAAGSGGQGGGYLEKEYLSAGGSTYAYQVGAGGLGGNQIGTADENGLSGDDSIFGTVGSGGVSAPGGAGGLGDTCSTSQKFIRGGGGGNVFEGAPDLMVQGGEGGISFSTGSPGFVKGGESGSSFLACFAAAVGTLRTTGSGNGNKLIDDTGYGAGGGGASGFGTFGTKFGGNGMPGIIIVEEYYD